MYACRSRDAEMPIVPSSVAINEFSVMRSRIVTQCDALNNERGDTNAVCDASLGLKMYGFSFCPPSMYDARQWGYSFTHAIISAATPLFDAHNSHSLAVGFMYVSHV